MRNTLSEAIGFNIIIKRRASVQVAVAIVYGEYGRFVAPTTFLSTPSDYVNNFHMSFRFMIYCAVMNIIRGD